MDDIAGQLARLDELRSKGTITDEEFQALKDKLVRGGSSRISTQNSAKVVDRSWKLFPSLVPLAALAVAIIVGFGYPLVNEGASNECSALEKVVLRKVAQKDGTDTSATSAAAYGFLAVLQGASDGKFAASLMKKVYPNMPPVIGCTMGYYRASFGGSIPSTNDALPRETASAASPAQPSTAGQSAPEGIVPLPQYNPAGQFARAPGNLPKTALSQVPELPGEGANGVFVNGQLEQRLVTAKGTAEIKWHVGTPEDSTATVLFWQDQKILADFTVSIKGGYPASGTPDLLIATTWQGGNCCEPDPLIVDITGDKPFVTGTFDLPEDGISINRRPNGLYALSGKNRFEKNSLGDLIDMTIFYDAKRKMVFRAPYDGQTDFASLVGQHPDALMGDPRGRLPLLHILGNSFADFREHLQVASNTRLGDTRYFIGAGCRPHSCNTSDGIYVIDVATGDAWALWFDDDKIGKAGPPLLESGEGYHAIDEWLKKHGSSVAQQK